MATLQVEYFGGHLIHCRFVLKRFLKNVPEFIFFILYFRKDIIKFAWNHLKSDDTIMKHWAYVLVCRFIAAYDTPSKIIFQVIFLLMSST